jgi:hypothetical protein
MPIHQIKENNPTPPVRYNGNKATKQGRPHLPTKHIFPGRNILDAPVHREKLNATGRVGNDPVPRRVHGVVEHGTQQMQVLVGGKRRDLLDPSDKEGFDHFRFDLGTM